jgi:septal ring factor EnvC (AmiA/AmiB activator)
METSFVPTNSLLRPSAMASPPPACGTIPHTVLTTFGVSNRGTLHSASTSSAPDLRRHFSLSHSPPNSESQPSQSTCSSLAPVGNRPIKSYQSPEQRDQEVCESLSLLHRQQATLEEQKKAFADVISKLSNICSELKTLSQSLKQTAENLSESQTTAIASTFRAELRAYYEKLEERLRPLTAPVDSSEPSLSQILSQVESSFGHISQIFIERWAHFEQQQKAAFDLLLKDISHSLQQCSQHRQCSALQTQNSQSSSSSSGDICHASLVPVTSFTNSFV